MKNEKTTEGVQKTKSLKISKKVNAIVLMAAAVAVFLLLNIIVEQIPLNFDTTVDGMYTLTETTKTVLKELEDTIYVYPLFDKLTAEADTGEGGKADLVKVLDLYDQSSKIKITYIDLDAEPTKLASIVGDTAAENYSDGDIVVKCGDTVRRIDEDDLYSKTQKTYNYFWTYYVTTGIQIETKLTSAIIKVTTGDDATIYYSTGFGEADISNYSTIIEYLKNCGYEFAEIDFKLENTIPDNAVCIMFFGPTEDITDSVYDMLERWLYKGHSAFFFMDIKDLDDEKENYIYDDFTYFGKLLANYGITLEKTLVEEGSAYALESSTDKIFQTSTKVAGSLEKLDKTTFNVFNTRSLVIDEEEEDEYTVEAILQTSTSATSKGVQSDNATRKGSAVIGASGINYMGTKSSRICVFGSSWSFSDDELAYAGSSAAKSIMLTSLEWMDLSSQKNVGDSIEAKEYTSASNSSYIEVTENQGIIIRTIVMIVIPAIIVLLGLVIWLRRRHL